MEHCGEGAVLSALLPLALTAVLLALPPLVSTDVQAGAFVMEYCGEVVPIEVAARRLEAYERAGEARPLLWGE